MMQNSLYKILFTLLITFSSLTTEAQTFHVMSFNIRIDLPGDGVNNWHQRKDGLLDLVQYYHPDILGVQETLGQQRTYIDSVLVNYASIGIGRFGDFESESVLIFYDSTKVKLLTSGTFWLSETQDTAKLGWDASYVRTCTYGQFTSKQTNADFWVFNTHLDNNGATARLEAAKLILENIGNLTEESASVILMGDLNCTPDSQPVQALKSALEYGPKISLSGMYGPKGTFNGFDPNIVIDQWIDYIFTRNMTVHNYRHIDDKLPNNLCVSDHLPVLVEVED